MERPDRAQPLEVRQRILRRQWQIGDVVAGKPGPVRDIVLLNAAAALLAYRGVSPVIPLVEQLLETKDDVAAAIDDGRASDVLDRWVAATNR